MARADGVGPDALDRVLLDQRHVLQRGGVEDDVGPEGGEAVAQGNAMAHVDQARLALDNGPLLAGLSVDAVKIEFRAVDEAEGGGTDGADLAHDLGADRAA